MYTGARLTLNTKSFTGHLSEGGSYLLGYPFPLINTSPKDDPNRTFSLDKAGSHSLESNLITCYSILTLLSGTCDTWWNAELTTCEPANGICTANVFATHIQGEEKES